MRRRLRNEEGQAAVEFVAVLPFVIVAALVAWQLVLVGHVAWDAAGAARSGARAALVGRNAGAAARAALPGPLRTGTRVVSSGAGGVRVSVPIPLVLYRWRTPLRVRAAASLGS
ncbi:MAG TPA: TadE/TadG family type IV pilus assembly protein [Thermoleophilaceae bacterium]|jgi:pilus assembly protein CpaE|nr:TadE/TadG family type IV pilus assembly protein [Thermoleophilaceae bacterium]